MPERIRFMRAEDCTSRGVDAMDLYVGGCSINVVFRQRKGVADMRDLRIGSPLGQHFDNVEAEADVGEVEQAQPGHGAFGYLPLFVIIDRISRATALLTRAGFDFDKDEGVFCLVTADEVDLTASGRDKVAVKKSEAVLTKVFGRLVFAPSTEDDMVRIRFF